MMLEKLKERLNVLSHDGLDITRDEVDALIAVAEAADEFAQSVYRERFMASSLDSPFFEKANKLSAALSDLKSMDTNNG